MSGLQKAQLAWKACDRQNWFASSNLALSAKNEAAHSQLE